MSNISDQRINSVASLQRYKTAKAAAAAKRKAAVNTPALTAVQIAERAEHEQQAELSAAALEHLKAAQFAAAAEHEEENDAV